MSRPKAARQPIAKPDAPSSSDRPAAPADWTTCRPRANRGAFRVILGVWIGWVAALLWLATFG